MGHRMTDLERELQRHSNPLSDGTMPEGHDDLPCFWNVVPWFCLSQEGALGSETLLRRFCALSGEKGAKWLTEERGG